MAAAPRLGAAAAANTAMYLSAGLSVEAQLALSTRVAIAAALGSLIGFERRNSDRPAGIRTLTLVSIGASIFTIVGCAPFAGTSDPTRVAAQIASGIGFIGAGVITTEPAIAKKRGSVRGMTTAAAIWIAAAIGVACGVGLHVVAACGCAMTVGVLEFSAFWRGALFNSWRLRSLVRSRVGHTEPEPLPWWLTKRYEKEKAAEKSAEKAAKKAAKAELERKAAAAAGAAAPAPPAIMIINYNSDGSVQDVAAAPQAVVPGPVSVAPEVPPADFVVDQGAYRVEPADEWPDDWMGGAGTLPGELQ